MKCPLCQSDVNSKDALPYMGVVICPECWKLKNPNKKTDDIKQSKRIKKEESKTTLSQYDNLDHKILHSLNSIEKRVAENRSIEIKDINMPFMSMVIFLVKWAIASIPAMIILFVVGGLVSAVFGGIFTAFLR